MPQAAHVRGVRGADDRRAVARRVEVELGALVRTLGIGAVAPERLADVGRGRHATLRGVLRVLCNRGQVALAV